MPPWGVLPVLLLLLLSRQRSGGDGLKLDRGIRGSAGEKVHGTGEDKERSKKEEQHFCLIVVYSRRHRPAPRHFAVVDCRSATLPFPNVGP